MSLFGSNNNTKTRALDRAALKLGGYAEQDRNRFLQAFEGGQEAVNRTTQAAVSSAMPQFENSLQGVRESAIRRGVSNGDLATSYEGDLASAFQRNISNAAASQATNIWNTRVGASGQLASESGNQWLDILAGNADRAQAASNAATSFWGGLIQGGMSLAGGFMGGR